MEPGVIRNRQYAGQVRDFSGLKFGTITPTDVDLMIEYRGIGYVYGELKYKDARLPEGQRLAFQRLCDDLSKVKPTLGIIARHESETEDIDVAAALVVECRWSSKWVSGKGETVRDWIDRFLKWLDMERAKRGDE